MFPGEIVLQLLNLTAIEWDTEIVPSNDGISILFYLPFLINLLLVFTY